ncbi:MAG: GntR family transcriptional regulator [Mycobacterium sp.]
MGLHEVRAGPGELTAGAGVPLHRQVFLVLHDEIAHGALAPGDSLPTEQVLCDQFGVSRITVRRALAHLADAGLIERRQGVGSFVRERIPSSAQAPSSDPDKTQFETEVDVIDLDVRPVPRVIADQLGSSEQCLRVLRLRRERRTGEPLTVTEAWLPADLAEVITEAALSRAPLHRLLSHAGIVLDRTQYEITAEVAGPRNARLLDTAIGSALLRVNRLNFADGRPHHFRSNLLSPNRSRLVLNQSAAHLETGGELAIMHDVLRG